MAIKTGIAGFMVASLGVLMLNASFAASVSYVLDQSGALPDGNDYVKVTIADGLDGAIDFTVEVLSALTDLARRPRVAPRVPSPQVAERSTIK